MQNYWNLCDMIGGFKDRIEILATTYATDAGGGRVPSTTSKGGYWCKAEPLTIRSFADVANREQWGKVYRFTFMYDNATQAALMTKDSVIVYKGNQYKINDGQSIDGADMFIRITATAIKGNVIE